MPIYSLLKQIPMRSVEHLEPLGTFSPRGFLTGAEDPRVSVSGALTMCQAKFMCQWTRQILSRIPGGGSGTFRFKALCSSWKDILGLTLNQRRRTIWCNSQKLHRSEQVHAHTLMSASRIFRGPESNYGRQDKGKHFCFQYISSCILCFYSGCFL